MLISNLQELRLFFPAHALSSIDPLIGFIDNSEHDFLLEKLGLQLYNKLCQYYAHETPSTIENEDASYMNRLLIMSQRCVAFDAFSRAIGVHAVSISNAGVNISTADDYAKPDKDALETYRNTCVKEAHSAVNRLLATLEEWTQQAADSDSSSSDEQDEERGQIVNLWKKSRYFYLAADLLLPSSVVLQEYLNHYDSREKFIQMLPDIRYIQEEMLIPGIGEGLTDYLVSQSQKEERDKKVTRTIHAARKFMAAALEERTEILRTNTNRRAKAHDEQVRLLQALKEYISANQASFLEWASEAMKDSPLYIDPDNNLAPYPTFENNTKGNAIFVTPPLR